MSTNHPARFSALLCASLLLAACGGSSEATRPTTLAPRADDPALAAATTAADENEPPLGQLPRDVVPEHYALALQIVPSQDRFSGSARIKAKMDKARSVIWMHGRNLDVTDVTVTPAGGEPVVAKWDEVDPEGVVALRLPREVGPGEVAISVTYNAPFDRQLKGLYRVDDGGDSYAFTQFEATSARLAFPSFDEPSFKTPFDIALTVPGDGVAIANTRAIGEEPGPDGTRTVRFATTEPLPTYLVALAVGPLDVVEV